MVIIIIKTMIIIIYFELNFVSVSHICSAHGSANPAQFYNVSFAHGAM